mmetsp:Transcript_45190/g.130900  ORF Transcript_45190/g.130900 Transcript_45190/m.130900 type:complete len:531 (-) Transcript_45190:68-1660(-)
MAETVPEEESGVPKGEAGKGNIETAEERTTGHLVFTHTAVTLQHLFWMSLALRSWTLRKNPGEGCVWRTLSAMVSATLLGDTVTYFTHLLLDNYLSEQGILGPLVHEFLLHHKSPKFQLQTYVENAWRESIFTASIMGTAIGTGLCNLRSSYSTTFWAVFGFVGTQISAIHKAAHVARPPLIYSIGQRAGLIIDRRHHAKHHATLASHYSLCTGHFEAAFEVVKGVECVEAVFYLLTGTVSRNSRLGLRSSGDQELRKSFGDRFQYLKWSIWYTFFNDFTTRLDLGINFMNWGYRREDGEQYPLPAGADRVLGSDPRAKAVNTASLQLYLHLLQGVPLEGRDVAEVSSGRGGFMACLAGSSLARSCLGVDACAGAVESCNKQFADLPGLSFRHGDAVAPLGFTVDVLVNVEASHCYPSREVFFRRVYEALRPGGHFLFADFMSEAEADQCVAWLEEDGFEVELREDVTPAVLRAMEYTNDAKIGMIKEHVPRMLTGFMERFAATAGSKSRGDQSDGWNGAVYLHLRARRR